MQSTNLPNFQNPIKDEIKEYAGPPLAPNVGSSLTPRTNDIDYQVLSEFSDSQQNPAPQMPQMTSDQQTAAPTTDSQDTQASTPPVSTVQPGQSMPPVPTQLTVEPVSVNPVSEVANPPVVNNSPVASSTMSTDAQAMPTDMTNVSPPQYQPANQTVNLSGSAHKIDSIDDLLSLAIEKGASDLHLSVGYPPLLRINGDLLPVPAPLLDDKQMVKLFSEVLNKNQQQQLQNYLDIDFSYTHRSGNRFRINIFYKQSQLAGAFRLIPSIIRSISDLGMPPVLNDFVNVAHGLVLVTGPTGSGKSTTIASVIQEINLTQPRHIITIEDPIEYVFPRAKALVNQREIGRDVRSWNRGLREILREDPDVVLVGEMRDYETIALTITAAETGHLVFSTLHTNSASQTIDRIIDVFPDAQQSQIRAQLANVIHAVVSQRLIPVKSGGRRAVSEIMIATPAIRNAIREKKTYQIDNMIQTGSELGMNTLEKSLVGLIRAGEITLDEAQAYTIKHNDLISLLKQN